MLRASCVRAAPDQDAGAQPKVVRLVPKWRCVEAALAACEAGTCQAQDVAVAAYLMSAIDRETGEAAVHYATVGRKCGMSRAGAGRSIKRLVEAGVIERAARFARNRAQIASTFTVGRAASAGGAARAEANPRPTNETPPSHQRDTKGSSRSFQHPVSGPGRQAHENEKAAEPGEAERTAWIETGEWLAERGRYVRYSGAGPGAAYRLARDDLDRWRREKGDKAMRRALDNARASGLHGDNLIDFLESTWPQGKGPRAGPRRCRPGQSSPVANALAGILGAREAPAAPTIDGGYIDGEYEVVAGARRTT